MQRIRCESCFTSFEAPTVEHTLARQARRAELLFPDRRLPAIASSGEAGGSPDRAKKKVILCASVVNLQKREV